MNEKIKKSHGKVIKSFVNEWEDCISSSHCTFSLCGFYFQLKSSVGSSSTEPYKTWHIWSLTSTCALKYPLISPSGQKALSYEPFSLNESTRARLIWVQEAVTEQRQSERSPAMGLPTVRRAASVSFSTLPRGPN